VSLALANVGVRYASRAALVEIYLTAQQGEVLAILGPNGSGKSTLLRAVAGLVPASGDITRPDAVAYLPQDNLSRAALTAFEVVLLGRVRSLAFRPGLHDLDAAAASLDELGITDLAQRRIGELSGGQRQLVFLAQVLAADPSLLLLDEPTSALDLAHQMHVLDHLRAATRRRGLTTIAVLHDLNAACRFADRIALLHEGRLRATGTPAEVLQPGLLRDVYGVRVAILPGPDGQPVIVPLALAGD